MYRLLGENPIFGVHRDFDCIAAIKFEESHTKDTIYFLLKRKKHNSHGMRILHFRDLVMF